VTPPARKPLLVVADDDRPQRAPVEDELRRRYGADYAIRGCAIAELEEALAEAAEAGADVAVVLAAGAAGAELLSRVRDRFPTARRGLLVPWLGWTDRTIADLILRSMARGWIDLYVLRPTSSPDEIFHRTVSELLQEAARLRGEGPAGATVVADARSARAHELRSALAGLGIPHRVVDRDDCPPTVTLANGVVLEDPSTPELTRALGFPTDLDELDADVVVVGAGPAGLAAAVYGASEGLRTTVLDAGAVGGQAGASSLIRNYLGFPRGLGGGELAQRAYQQAWLFGARFRLTQRVVALERTDGGFGLRTADGVEVTARAVVLALGVEYRRLTAPGLAELEGAGVYYGASMSEAQALAGEDVFVVGGGNSAGQAALHLARWARQVTILVRNESLAATMSQYLIEAIDAAPNVSVRSLTTVEGASGRGRLETLELRDAATGELTTERAAALVVLIGAHPHTEWLPPEVERDESGYLVTDPSLETTMPGVFAAGDVRSGAVKRVAAAAGAGALAISGVHAYLAREAER
jgi:thioredoxin reductase (NADPH)